MCCNKVGFRGLEQALEFFRMTLVQGKFRHRALELPVRVLVLKAKYLHFSLCLLKHACVNIIGAPKRRCVALASGAAIPLILWGIEAGNKRIQVCWACEYRLARRGVVVPRRAHEIAAAVP